MFLFVSYELAARQETSRNAALVLMHFQTIATSHSVVTNYIPLCAVVGGPAQEAVVAGCALVRMLKMCRAPGRVKA